MPKLSFFLMIFLSFNSDYLVKGLSIYNSSTTKAPNLLSNFIDPPDNISYACPTLSEDDCGDLPDKLCFDQPFPYSSTSVKADNASLTLYNKVLNHLDISGMDISCWNFLKPLLCLASRPKCDKRMVYLPSRELCQKAKETCNRTLSDFNDWNCESFSECKKENYTPKIQSYLHSAAPWNKSVCVPPLIRTVVREHWVQDIIGCGLPCKNSFYSEEKHLEAYMIIKRMAMIILVVSLFATFTSLLIPKFRDYPECLIVSIFIDLVIISIGWLIQIFPGAHNSITCFSDGTLRMTHPNYTDFTCVLTFILTYAFGVHAIVKFVELSYASYKWSKSIPFPLVLNWEITLFQFAAWTIPYILTFLAFILKKISGDPMSGTCSVGLYDTTARMLFVVLPVFMANVVAAGFFLYASWAVSDAITRISNVEEKNTTRVSAHKIYWCSFLALFAVLRILYIECYFYFYEKKWMPIFDEDIYIREGNILHLSMEHKPNSAFVKIQFMLYFVGTLCVMMLLIGESIYNPWKDFLKRSYENFKNACTSLMRRCALHNSSLKVPMHGVYFQRKPSLCTVHRLNLAVSDAYFERNSTSAANESNSIVSGFGYQPDEESSIIMDHRIDCSSMSCYEQNCVISKALKTHSERNALVENRIVPSVHSSDSSSVPSSLRSVIYNHSFYKAERYRIRRVKSRKEKLLSPTPSISSLSSTVII